jgi:hypothetical protein
VKRDQGELGVRVLVPGELVDKIATRGFVSVLSASQPEKETTLNSRIEGTEKLLQKVQGAGERDAAGWSDLINLTELYILRGARADLTQARTNIQTIGRKPAEYEGYALLLGLMLSTMYEPNDAAVAAAEKWVEWLKSGRVTNSWGWNWSLWYEPGRVPEPKLKAIRLIDGASPRVDEGAAGASAQNRLTPDQFLEAFRRELGVSEKSEEPRLYVQIGAGRNLGALKNWAKQLEGEGRKTLIFEIPGGDVPRYAITLDRHAPAEAKRLAEEWRASDPKHQAWVLEGKTYKRQVR